MPGSSNGALHIPPHQRFGRPVEFVRFDLRTKLWSKQAEILRTLKWSKRTAVRSCNGSGKTHAAAAAVLWWLLAHEHSSALAITTAPTQRQVKNLLWREIRQLCFRNPWVLGNRNGENTVPRIGGLTGGDCADATKDECPPGANETTHLFPSSTSISQTSLELSPDHYALGLSTDSPERFQGFHERNILFVVDEASGVHEEVFEAIEGSMTSRRARLLLIGNPTSVSGTFYRAFHQNRSQYKTIHIPASSTPNLALHTQLPGIVTPAWVDDAATTWGKDSTQYQVRVLGEFPTNADDTLIPLKHIEAATNRQSDPAPAHRPASSTPLPDRKGQGVGESAPKDESPPGVNDAARASSLHREGPREGRLQRRPSHPMTPGAINEKGQGVGESAPKDESPPGAHDAARASSLLREGPREGRLQRRPSHPMTPGAINEKGQGVGESAPKDESPPGANDLARPCHAELDSVSLSRAHSPDTANHPDRTQPIHIGVDIARFGTDRTVICIRQGNHVIALNQHQKLNTMRTTGLIVDAIHKYNPQTVNIDEIGVGAGVLDRLHELGYTDHASRSVLPRTGGARGGDSEPSRPTTSATNAKTVVHGVNVGTRATDPEHFFNLRSELYDNLRARFEEQTIVIPNDDDLIGQLAAIRVEYTSRGQLKVEPKETMRRRSLPSPDKADALLLAFAPTNQPTNNFKIWV